MDYYHDTKMQKLFKILEQPRSLEDMDLSENFIRKLVLKIIATYGNIPVSRISEITGIYVDILEEVLKPMEREELISPIGGGFLFASVTYTIKQLGRSQADKLLSENPYIGMAPVSYDIYYQVMEAQIKGRFPIKVPKEVIDKTFKDVVGNENGKTTLVESAIGGKGLFIYGLPGTGKTFLTSKMSDLLPPLVIPRYIEFSEQVIQLYDPDFHKECPEQPKDPRWVKIYAPFVFTGSELTTEKLETNFDPHKGVYETSPIIKANGGVLLLDDLGRQKEDHNALLNRLIVPLENKKDMIYVKGAPMVVHSHFIPAFSTNLDITIMDEAHLRRAPLHISLESPTIDEIVEVFEKNLNEMGEKYGPEVLDRYRLVYRPVREGGEGLQPTFAHARDLAQMAQAIRIRKDEEEISVETMDESLKQHVLIAMQRRFTPTLFERVIRKKRD
ncbi:ATP-binding protein [Methanobacterium alcaliphilum]|uniref:ATP-binding protein n=1 Tax=Methanobacterium alcaliphilum TaxID=392018 RepID=UPI00200AD0CB|nr:ATP-binding protein [Methanobacterium alcaliphilum]MCK9152607.1 ATP-binding protein [Methanobacterium alcaliphilum]